MKTKAIIMLVVVTTLLLSSITYGCGTSSGIVKPTVGHIPPGWYCGEDPYGTLEIEGRRVGFIECVDTGGSYSSVMILYGDVFPELKGKESDKVAFLNTLIARATKYHSKPYESGIMTVAGESAGWSKVHHADYDWYNMEIIFVKGSTGVEIRTLYEATSEDAVMSLIDSIDLPMQ